MAWNPAQAMRDCYAAGLPYYFPTADVIPIEAVAFEARRDRAALAMENAALCRQLRAAGLEPVTKSSDEWVELYERCMAVVRAASDLVAHLGTSKEMLDDWR
jgi:hypothetical protein